MIKLRKVELDLLIKSDLYRYCGSFSRKLIIKNLVGNSGFRYMYILRKCQYYKQKKTNMIQYIFFRMLLRKYAFKYGYEIPSTLKVGKGFYINHFNGITINSKAIIGNNVNITKGITIGKTNRGSRKGVPTIGNSVWIGANATIVGNIKVGDNVLIAPNSYVNFDVPNNSIVIGNPAIIKPSDKATEGYCNYQVK